MPRINGLLQWQRLGLGGEGSGIMPCAKVVVLELFKLMHQVPVWCIVGRSVSNQS